jgi:hypothetical protein
MRTSQSGRVVIDITPEQKRAIYAELKARSGTTMREWFLAQARADGLLDATSPPDTSPPSTSS